MRSAANCRARMSRRSMATCCARMSRPPTGSTISRTRERPPRPAVGAENARCGQDFFGTILRRKWSRSWQAQQHPRRSGRKGSGFGKLLGIVTLGALFWFTRKSAAAEPPRATIMRRPLPTARPIPKTSTRRGRRAPRACAPSRAGEMGPGRPRRPDGDRPASDPPAPSEPARCATSARLLVEVAPSGERRRRDLHAATTMTRSACRSGSSSRPKVRPRRSRSPKARPTDVERVFSSMASRFANS